MKMTSTILADFTHDFGLEMTEFGVCFDALINFNLPMQHFNIESEIHLDCMLSDRIDTVYLLNPIIETYRMPTFFNDANHEFLYLEKTGLVVSGTLPVFGAYSISIFPKAGRCSSTSLHEIKSKKLN